MNIPAIRAAIAKLGQGEYQDGSSAAPGTTYQPIGDWIPELADIPCHKPEAVRDDFWAVVRDYAHHAKRGWTEASVYEIGAANGYYALGLYRLGADVYPQERDPCAAAVIDTLGLSDGAGGTRRVNDSCPSASYDVGLVLNVHMWLTKQGHADGYMTWVAQHCGTVYFQTAGKHSGGMCIIPELDSVEAEERYLERYFAGVHHARTTTLHGGVRHLWRCTS